MTREARVRLVRQHIEDRIRTVKHLIFVWGIQSDRFDAWIARLRVLDSRLQRIS